MNLVDEIYAVLVERFGVGEVCVKKHGKRVEVTWKKFIEGVLNIEAENLHIFSGFGTPDTLSKYFKRNYTNLFITKDGKHWKKFLLSLVDQKICPGCNTLKPTSEFFAHSTEADGLQTRCKDCGKEYRSLNKEYIKNQGIEYRKANKEHLSYISKQYYKENKEEIDKKHREYHALNKESINQRKHIYYQNNKHLYKAYDAKRRASIIQATPKWADLEKIKEMYKSCPEGYHVDHWAPLKGELVCGLHCEFNLQHLTAAENLAKSNKFEIC